MAQIATDIELAQYRAITTEKLSVFRRLRSLFIALWEGQKFSRAVKEAHGVGRTAQLLELAKAQFRVGVSAEQFYLHQYCLPDRGSAWRRHVDASGRPQGWLIARCGKLQSGIMHDKIAFSKMAEAIGLPTVPLLATFEDGKTISTCEAFPADLFSKPSNSWRGHHSALWRYEAGLYRNANNELALQWSELLEHLRGQSERQRRAFILQAAARNHQGLAPLTNGALATVRIVTCRTPSGSIDLMPPALKMPWGSAIADNMAQGGVVAPIDLSSGRICGAAYRKDHELGSVKVLQHPDTGTLLADFELPFWSETVDLARAAHAEFASLFFIGWDIAILEDGPVILEGNPHWDPDVVLLSHRITAADTQFVPYWLHAYHSVEAESVTQR